MTEGYPRREIVLSLWGNRGVMVYFGHNGECDGTHQFIKKGTPAYERLHAEWQEENHKLRSTRPYERALLDDIVMELRGLRMVRGSIYK